MAWQKSHKYRVWIGSGVVVIAILIHQLTPLLTLLEPDGALGAATLAYIFVPFCAWVAAFIGVHMAFIGVVLHWRATAGVSRSSWVCSLAAILVAHAAFIALWLGERPCYEYFDAQISPGDSPPILVAAFVHLWFLAMKLAAAYSSAFIALMLARHHWRWFTLGSMLPLGWMVFLLGWMVFRICASLFGS